MALFGITAIQTPKFICRIFGHRYQFMGMGVIAPDAERQRKAERALGLRRHCERCGRAEPERSLERR